MPGKPQKPPEKVFEVLAYKSDGTFFSWYRINAHDLLSRATQQRQKRGATWPATLSPTLDDVTYIDMPPLADDRVSTSLLTFSPGTALVELHRDGELVALASLHLAVDAEAGARFARLVKQTLPDWHNVSLTEDLLTSANESVLFLVQAPGDASHMHWLTISEGALLMMAAFCRNGANGGAISR